MHGKFGELERIKEIALLSAALSFTILISMNVVLPNFIASFGVDIAVIGLAFSLRSVVRCAARLISGAFSYVVGRKSVILLGLLIKALAFFTIFSSVNVIMVVVGMIILSFSEGLIDPVFLASTADIFAETSMTAMAFGIAFSIRNIPSIIAPAFTGYIADNMGVRVTFLLGVLFSILGVFVSLKIKFERYSENVDSKVSFRTVKNIMSKPFSLLLLSSVFLFMAVSSLSPIFSYLFVYELGYSYTVLGIILTVGAFVGVFSRIYIGYISDRIGHINTLILVGFVRTISVLLLIFVREPILIAFSYILRVSVMAAPPRNALISILCEREVYNLAYSVVGIFIDIGRIAGPVIVGYVISQYGFNLGFIAISLFFIAFTLTLLVLKFTTLKILKSKKFS